MSFVVNNTTIKDKIQIVETESTKETKEFKCQNCKGAVQILAKAEVTLKDMPDYPETVKLIKCHIHRYRCEKCGKTFTEEIENKYPGTRVTNRAAEWVKSLLKHQMTIKGVQKITGIHWDTISRIHKEIISEAVDSYEEWQRKEEYKPKYLAVDEFAIHKGHRYATCVMDLGTGHVIWVGKGRAKADFIKFFQETDMSYLSEVRAVAMDMNASYNMLVEKYLPNADVVYDRYHMQSQYGKEVLGVVRLEEAREHRENSLSYKAAIEDEEDPIKRYELKAKAKEEQSLYSKTKQGRWLILSNPQKLNAIGKESLQNILDKHARLSLCYAMKEEMRTIFDSDNPVKSHEMWNKWFDAAKDSEIYALKHFAELKEKRIPGLVAHAIHGISTGPLEGLNNKIKVAKRIAYGFRNEEYFFKLIRYMTIPSIRYS